MKVIIAYRNRNLVVIRGHICTLLNSKIDIYIKRRSSVTLNTYSFTDLSMHFENSCLFRSKVAKGNSTLVRTLRTLPSILHLLEDIVKHFNEKATY